MVFDAKKQVKKVVEQKIIHEVMNRSMMIVCLCIDLSDKVGKFDVEMADHLGAMDSTVSSYVQELSDTFCDVDVSNDDLLALRDLMDKLQLLCNKYGYNENLHSFDKRYEQLTAIMRSRGLIY